MTAEQLRSEMVHVMLRKNLCLPIVGGEAVLERNLGLCGNICGYGLFSSGARGRWHRNWPKQARRRRR